MLAARDKLPLVTRHDHRYRDVQAVHASTAGGGGLSSRPIGVIHFTLRWQATCLAVK